MTGLRRALAAVAVLLCVLGVVTGGAGSAAAAGANAYAADRVVVVGVPGLAWSDVHARSTPQLWRLAGSSAIGALSVRGARSTTCVLDGWATLGAGNRARFPGSDNTQIPMVPLPEGSSADGGASGQPPVDASLSHCGLEEQVAHLGLLAPRAAVRAIGQDSATQRFGAEPAALGSAVGCAGVVGRSASLAVAGAGVRITSRRQFPGTAASLGRLLSGCPLTVLSLEQLSDAGRPGVRASNTGTDPAQRPAAVGDVDAQIGRVRAAIAALPGRTLLVVAGISEVNDGRPRLHVGIVSGPGFSGGGWLTSSSTGRAQFAQLIDVAPTVLRALGKAQPRSMNGEPMSAAGGRPGLAAAVSRLDREDVAAAAHYRSTADYFWVLVGAVSSLVVLAVALLGGLPRPRRGSLPSSLRGLWRAPGRLRGGRRRRAVVRLPALLVAALPVASYLAGLLPWERSSAVRWALLGSVALADVVVAAVAAGGPWRRARLGPPAAVLVITLVTLVADVVTGSHLEMNGLLGYDAIVAGRFVGYGNLTFALLVVSALPLTAALAAGAAGRVRPERARRTAAAVTLAAGLVVVGIDGAPGLGRDFGGVLSAVPGFLVLALLITRTRITVARMVAVLGTAVVVVGAVAFLDWLRPAAQRTHLGRFVEQVLTGEAWTVVSRKAEANVAILLHSPMAWLLPVVLVAALWLVRPGGVLRATAGRGPSFAPAEAVVLRAGLTSTALALVLGALVNDSGVAVLTTGGALAVPLLVWCAAARRGGDPPTGRGAAGHLGSRPDEDANGVTVGSRGSTVWNA